MMRDQGWALVKKTHASRKRTWRARGALRVRRRAEVQLGPNRRRVMGVGFLAARTSMGTRPEQGYSVVWGRLIVCTVPYVTEAVAVGKPVLGIVIGVVTEVRPRSTWASE